MPDNRRTPSRGPRRDTRGAVPRRRPSVAGRSGASAVSAPARSRPRLTGRAAILVLVVAVLAVSYASSLRAYLQQRGQIDDLQSQIEKRQNSIDTLQNEKDRFSDPAYVAARARLLGYVNPGETPYAVRKDGAALAPESALGDPATIDPSTPRAWWVDAWASMQVAGHPPTKADPVPQTLIEGSAH